MRINKLWPILVLLCILLIGSVARFYKLDEKSLWSDEIATIATSMGNSIDPDAYSLRKESFDPPAPVAAEVYKLRATQAHGKNNLGQTAIVLKDNIHPPLFFWLMNLWIHAFGLDAGLLRIPAALFGVLSIALMYGLALKLTTLTPVSFSEKGRYGFALLASSFMAFSAYQIDHAQDARQYTLLICLALGAIWLMVDLIQKQGKGLFQWVLLALLLAAGLYTQYFFFLFMVFVLGRLLWQARYGTAFLTGVFGCGLLIALLFVPWLVIFKQQMVFLAIAGHYTAGLWNPVQLPEKLWRVFCEFFLPDNKIGKLVPLLILLGWGMSAWFVKTRRNTAPFAAPVLMIALSWLLFLGFGQIVLDILRDAHTATIRRYLLLASPAACLLLSYAFYASFQNLRQFRWQWAAVVLTGLFIGLMGLDAANSLFKTHTSSDEFKLAAAHINRTSSPTDLVLVSKTGAMAVGMAYYLKPETRILGVDVPNGNALLPDSPLMGKLTEAVEKLPPGSRVWLAFSHTAPSTRERLIRWLTHKGYLAGPEYKVPGVRVYEANRTGELE